MEGLEEFSLEMLRCGAKETFKNKHLTGMAVKPGLGTKIGESGT